MLWAITRSLKGVNRDSELEFKLKFEFDLRERVRITDDDSLDLLLASWLRL
jgi:hypothetical protein